MQRARTVWNEKIQSRVVSTSNVLAQLKNIKAMGLNTAISKFLQEKPLSETGTSMSERNARIFIFAICKMKKALSSNLSENSELI